VLSRRARSQGVTMEVFCWPTTLIPLLSCTDMFRLRHVHPAYPVASLGFCRLPLQGHQTGGVVAFCHLILCRSSWGILGYLLVVGVQCQQPGDFRFLLALLCALHLIASPRQGVRAGARQDPSLQHGTPACGTAHRPTARHASLLAPHCSSPVAAPRPLCLQHYPVTSATAPTA
jgi:hypothetical protein